jgi:exodeoxyribonuclease VII small subunit
LNKRPELPLQAFHNPLKQPAMTPNLTYKQATQELETILKAIENDDVDVDELTQKVQRSSELIKLCKQKLRTAEDAINQVFQDINCEDPKAE